MLAIVVSEDGKQGIVEQMEALQIPISSRAQKYMKSRDDCRTKKRETRKKSKKEAYLRMLTRAVINVEDRASNSIA